MSCVMFFFGFYPAVAIPHPPTTLGAPSLGIEEEEKNEEKKKLREDCRCIATVHPQPQTVVENFCYFGLHNFRCFYFHNSYNKQLLAISLPIPCKTTITTLGRPRISVFTYQAQIGPFLTLFTT